MTLRKCNWIYSFCHTIDKKNLQKITVSEECIFLKNYLMRKSFVFTFF